MEGWWIKWERRCPYNGRLLLNGSNLQILVIDNIGLVLPDFCYPGADDAILWVGLRLECPLFSPPSVTLSCAHLRSWHRGVRLKRSKMPHFRSGGFPSKATFFVLGELPSSCPVSLLRISLGKSLLLMVWRWIGQRCVHPGRPNPNTSLAGNNCRCPLRVA